MRYLPGMKVELEFPWTEEELSAAVAEVRSSGKSDPLRSLCQKEVEHFEQAVTQHPDYADGLVKIERLAVMGYLVQKLLGHC
jgi:hypothetical protein